MSKNYKYKDIGRGHTYPRVKPKIRGQAPKQPKGK